MGELDEKLNAILSNPDTMAQVIQMAQQLSSTFNDQQTPPSAPPPPVQNVSAHPNDNNSFLGGLDPGLAAKFLPLLQEFGKSNTQAMQLLNALRPYLREEKQEKIQRAAKLARIIHLGKKFLMEWEG